MESLREILEENERQKAQKRGSVFVTVLIIIIFALGAAFYIKTAKPQFFEAAVACIKDMAGKTLETVSDSLAEGAETEQNTQTVPQGEMLRSAETFDFCYISESLVQKFETDDFCVFPVNNASVTSDFGARTDPVTGEQDAGHHGIDLAAPEGSEIFAYDGGTVKNAGTNDIYGNFVLLSHKGYDSFYGHLSALSVQTGDTVSAGECIGIIGSSGKSTGIHLHFEIREKGSSVDPAPYLYEKI